MFEWRITKYNPDYRDSNGVYTKDEWIAVSDIGESFDGDMLSEAEYISVENAYISSATKLFAEFSAEYFSVKYIEAYGKMRECKIKSSSKMKRIYYTIRHGKKFRIDDLPDVLRLILREHMWCVLCYEDKLEIRVGYDYYMYAKSTKVELETLTEIENMELFAEEYPYRNVERDTPLRWIVANIIKFKCFVFRRLMFLFVDKD